MTGKILGDMKHGEILHKGNKIYSYCSWCESLVCINKLFFGALHFCSERNPDVKISHKTKKDRGLLGVFFKE